jgi:lipopolysaccharide export system permease protein
MRLYQKAALREMTGNSGIALGAISAILVVILTVRILGDAAIGEIAAEAVLPFIGFGFLRLLPVLLSVSLFIGVLLTLGRYWHDNEMVIWSGTGIGPLAWVVPVMIFALPVAVLIGSLSLWLNPWAAGKKSHYEYYLSSMEDVASLTPGVFTESEAQNRVYFVEYIGRSDPRVKNVFIQSEQQGKLGVVVSGTGEVQTHANGDRFLVLEKGHRYEGIPGQADYKEMQFDRYSFRLEPSPTALDDSPRQRSTAELLRDPTPQNQAEWVWRMGHPISAVILALLAIPLSVFNPRAGRSMNLLFAVLTYTLYNNVIGLSQAWILRRQLDVVSSMLVVHGSALLILFAVFAWRFGNFRIARRR